MDKTPNTRSAFNRKLKRSEIRKSPRHSTPETSSSKKTPEASSEQFSPINSPSKYDRLSQDIQVFWGWKSPEEISIKKTGIGTKTGFKANVTPSRIYSSPKPKRKLNSRNYSDNLRSLAAELKSLSEGIKSSTLPGKSVKEESKYGATNKIGGTAVDVDVSGNSKQHGEDDVSTAEKPKPVTEEVKASGGMPQDLFVVELSPGDLTSLKSFPVNHQFPKVPKLDLETAMNSSDYTVLMEDNSIEDEVMRFTQKVEEEFISRNKMEGKIVTTPQRGGSVAVVCNVAKKMNSINSPKTPSSASKFQKSPALSRRSLSLRKSSTSPGNKPSKLDETVSWDSNCNVARGKKLGSVVEEDVMGMLADDSFDNIMLEMEVQTEPKKQATSFHQDKKNVLGSSASGGNVDLSLKTEGDLKLGDSLGMLEDDSLIQPDVLNFLDTVESQAIAASQPLKCTPEEIKLKMMEAKKKLAVGKRKRKSQLKLNEMQPEIKVTSKTKC